MVKRPNLSNPNLIIDDQYMEDFAREAELSYMLSNHPNVVQFIGASTDASLPQLLYQYVAGGTIEKLLIDELKYDSEKLDDVKLVKLISYI